jgi:hypothetical protein
MLDRLHLQGMVVISQRQVHKDTTDFGVSVGLLAEMLRLRHPFSGTCPLTEALDDTSFSDRTPSFGPGAPGGAPSEELAADGPR